MNAASPGTVSLTQRRDNNWAVAHVAFHDKLIDACGSPVLLDICRRRGQVHHGQHRRRPGGIMLIATVGAGLVAAVTIAHLVRNRARVA